MWNKLYNYFFFNPTHKITGYPISTVNGLKCEIIGEVDHYFKDMERSYIRLEKAIPRNGGGKERKILLHSKYLTDLYP